MWRVITISHKSLKFLGLSINMSANNNNIIDLTCAIPFSLADHSHLDNVVIELDTDDSFRGEINVENNAVNAVAQPTRRKLTPRKKQSTKPRTSIQQVHNLSKPDKEAKKVATKNKKVHSTTPGEPKEKKTRTELKYGCCPICFDDLGSKPVSSTKCGHVFCTDCIKRSMKSVAQCPQCRTKLRGSTAVHPLYFS